MSQSPREEIYKKMAELLKAGNTMLAESCPDCKVPLFKMKDGKIICPSCNRVAIYVKHGEEESVNRYQVIEKLISTVTGKLVEIESAIANEYDEVRLKNKVDLMISLLDAYEKLSKLKGS
ncbi:MAG TPA: Sjogren's syndrome/scleroderma autoantigen 1 family protein [Geobacterales bacterium]|nr:Sjogren's syndrome/scleroderma autoantigen 1 family protein [Geobacterales bacterium]